MSYLTMWGISFLQLVGIVVFALLIQRLFVSICEWNEVVGMVFIILFVIGGISLITYRQWYLLK